MKKISIITPCYNEELNVENCHRVVADLFANELNRYDYEHIFADNNSSDSTPVKLRALAENNPKVKIILNSKNFGPFRSSFNALLAAEGDAVLVFLPADLQDPPELLPKFIELWEQGKKVVYGIRANREESFLMERARRVYYRLVNSLASIDIPKNVGEFQLIDKKVVEELKKCDDHYPYIRGLIAYCGFDSIGIEYVWRKRKKGISKNNLWDLLDQGLNGLISFTTLPLRLFMMSGFVLALASIIYAFIQLIINMCSSDPRSVAGIPTLIVAIFFFSGVQLFVLGLLGEYLGSIHRQVRKRPMVIEKERINFKKK